jgi:hypothetical protein
MDEGIPGSIIFENDKGEKQEITTPSLNVIFRCKELQESFNNNPERKYSVNDIIGMIGNLAPNKNTLRTNLSNSELYFDDTGESISGHVDYSKDSEPPRKRLVTLKLFKLKPLVEYIFKAINGDDDDE